MKTASTLPNFTPSHGHTYLPPTARTTATEPGQQPSQQSKENTPMPDIASQTQSSTEAPSTRSGLGISNTNSSYQDTRSLAEAFNLYTRYGDEFMDENPLQGEPGSFILSRNTGDNERGNKNTTKTASVSAATANTPVPGRVSTPQVRVDTPGKASDKSNSPPSSGDNKGKKKKSRVVN